ncbi:MAG TPA: hypothetical protein EYH45_01450 [Candidatus Caldiarchaeum subterraneum]|uniref:LUD domain-containing protein n=1 Tax=Caldiarchaeum subterraneum TaxID=311458 RepID=A0A833EBV5_CALS0|nr:hypothetical protein [Aigarchaeota archaeon]HIQ29210.1 hypothetical protein [Candidatus Caldarchaeum subterraneum]
MTDAVSRFVSNATAAGSEVVELKTLGECFKRVVEVLQVEGVKHVSVQPSSATAPLYEMLRGMGYNVVSPAAGIKPLSVVEAGISPAELGIAETGTVVVATDSEAARLVSALPLINIILLDKSNIIESLVDAHRWVRGFISKGYAVSFITGPSKTGDIELKMVKGVHGPHRVLVFIHES